MSREPSGTWREVGHDERVGFKGYVILSGPPASGKSTLGPALAGELDTLYLAKDTIKQALIEELGAADVEASRKLGAAAMRALIAVARQAGAGVLDGTWLRDRTPGLVSSLPGPLVEVFCRCPQEVMEQRFAVRATARGPGHFDAARRWSELGAARRVNRSRAAGRC